MVHLKLLFRYALAPYAPGGPVVAAPSVQSATYRDGATGQVFVRQPPVNILSLVKVLIMFFIVQVIPFKILVMFFIVLVMLFIFLVMFFMVVMMVIVPL